jgi:hypothetical protein
MDKNLDPGYLPYGINIPDRTLNSDEP